MNLSEKPTLKSLTSTDRISLLTLHNKVFNSAATNSWFNWKYANNPVASSGLWLKDGSLVAHCGGIPRELFYKNQKIAGLQISDVMVDPKWRGLLLRQGPFYEVSAHFYKHQIGNNHPYSLGFGFPNQRHLRLATHLNLLTDAGSIFNLSWNLKDNKKLTRWQATSISSETLTPTLIESLWQIMQNDSLAYMIGARDTTYIKWRFQHPEHQYQVLGLKQFGSSKIHGLIWVKEGNNPKELMWLDWLGPCDHIARAWQALAKYALKKNISNINAWASKSVYDQLTDTLPNTSVVAKIGIPNRSQIDLNTLVEMPWWWMAGDTDFL